jgi:ribosomal protein L7Ae-like RNA K-turn-binding protein
MEVKEVNYKNEKAPLSFRDQTKERIRESGEAEGVKQGTDRREKCVKNSQAHSLVFHSVTLMMPHSYTGNQPCLL